MKKLRILVLMHETLIPPESLEGYTIKEYDEFKAEFDVVHALRKAGHEVRPIGLYDNLAELRAAIVEWQPDLAFNLLEEFQGIAMYDQHVVSFLELMRQPYTGCNP
ncbi:MAG: D-alanine--D-alanine ligase, partial [Candidatus Obscuribacterales bacterium]|nr:D-alanine--D-alanine ligase [Steroidobacteraceae bacterium]